MIEPPLPDNEIKRITSLLRLKILDTPPEERFDRITRLVKAFFNAPIVLVSLVDSDRQWFKSCQGLNVTETPRNISFCGHAIIEKHIFIIEDATKDPRFSDNPLVTGSPDIRFYAGAPLSSIDGNRVGTLCIIDDKPRKLSAKQQKELRDFADIVENELNLMDINASINQEVELNSAKSKFLSVVSHELRTPITIIKEGISIIQDDTITPLTEKQNKFAALVMRNANRLMRLINNVLDFQKLDAHKMQYNIQAVSMDDVIQEALSSMAIKAKLAGLRLTSCIPGKLPSLNIDRDRMLQVLYNLLDNAIKFSSAGSEVQLRVLIEKNVFRVEIIDTACGITWEDIPKLFKSFNQVGSFSERKTGSSGLGLVISKNIITDLGGTMDVISEFGKGSTFYFTLPIVNKRKSRLTN